ncbi:MAG: R.Pab1 family restriction endonuclease, partial [Clostridia bacterium]|nr:R.Pab1 family restriction endonuclease [Clostridia bacterium]
IKYFYDWRIVKKDELVNVKKYLSNLSKEDYIDTNSDLMIKRTRPVKKKFNGYNFSRVNVEYPLLVYKLANSESVAEIKITEKQKAIGTQPMLYLCIPVTKLENGKTLLERTAQTKETANFVINSKNISVFLEMLKLFGTLSKNHNQDVISIIDVILG